ncbi:MAG: hypothetical protein DMG54_19125 [Acidobacteria bacterium]|nr:MAG: hypothetical protein DMG54_19125 [Acidobacteriota bacterium]
MNPSFEQTLVEVWRQVHAENADAAELGTERYPVRRTTKRGLRQVDFVFSGNELRGLGQNPDTKSRWAQMARSGKKVMQFLSTSMQQVRGNESMTQAVKESKGRLQPISHMFDGLEIAWH